MIPSTDLLIRSLPMSLRYKTQVSLYPISSIDQLKAMTHSFSVNRAGSTTFTFPRFWLLAKSLFSFDS